MGPAPLAVQFDASGQGAFNGVYEFNFGDPSSGTWAVSGLAKNTQRGGPIAAHVYDAPGTYVATVGGASVTITVQDPNTVYAGASTVCVSTSANYTSCPSGALTQTGLPASYAGKRVLLRRGESFAAVQPLATDTGFQVGAFGTGAKPRVLGVAAGGPAAGSSAVTSDWTVMDLDVGTGAVNVEASTSRFLLYRSDVVRYGSSDAMINIGTAAGFYQAHGHPTLRWPTEVFLVENDVLGVVGTRSNSPNLTAMGFFYRSALMGNTMDRAFEHTLRIWATGKTFIAHNAIGGNHTPEADGIGIRGALKLHSNGEQTFTESIATSPTPASSRVVVANNRFGSPTYPGSWMTGLAPQNTDAVEGLEDFVAENNVFVRGPHTTIDMTWKGRRMTKRGNTVQGGGAAIISTIGAAFPPGSERWDGPYY